MHPAQALGFDWDDANVEHLAAHGITQDEVDQVFDSVPIWRRDRQDASGDWRMTGRTHGGRWLTIVVQVLEEQRQLRAFTGWGASEHEKAIYRRQRGGRR